MKFDASVYTFFSDSLKKNYLNRKESSRFFYRQTRSFSELSRPFFLISRLNFHRLHNLVALTTYRKSSIKPPGGLFISSPFDGGLTIETGGLFEREVLFNFETTMVLGSSP